MCGDEEDRGGESDGDGRGKVAALGAQEPGDCRPDAEGGKGEERRETQRGEAGAGEVEERGHGKGIVADAAMGEEIVDVGERGEVARGPQAEGQGRGDGDAEDGERGVGEGEPAAGGSRFGVAAGISAFGARERCGDEHQQREIGGEGVVLLVGGEREEGDDLEGEDAEEQRGALRGGEVGERFGMAGVPGAGAAIAPCAPGGEACERDSDD